MALHMHVGDVAWKTLFFYVFLLLLLRVCGKREIGAFNAIDLVGFIMISEAAIISIADSQIPFLVGVIPVVMLGGLEWVFAYLSLKDKRVRNLVEGEPTVLISHGRIDQDKLRGLRYNLSDLMAEMRSKNIANLADVEFAVLETTGKLSVFPRAGARPVTADDLVRLRVTQADPVQVLPTPDLPASVVLDGEVDEEALARAGKDRVWLEQQLRNQGMPGPEGVLVASLDRTGHLVAHAREDPLGLSGQRPPDRESGDGGGAGAG